MTPRICLLLVTAASLAGGCEKSSKEPDGSGALSSEDKGLFNNVPSDANIVFGGNYMKVQEFMEASGMGAMSAKLGGDKGMRAFVNCFGSKDSLRLAGAMKLQERGARMHMVLGGISMKDLEGCAKTAEATATVSEDGNYVTVEATEPEKSDIAFLKLKDGSLYTRIDAKAQGGMAALGSPKYTATPREALENDIASAAKSNIAGDSKLNDVISKVDRTKTFWFAGSLAGTPAASQVNEVYGSLDLAKGFGLFLSAEVTEKSLADKVEDGYDKIKSMSDQLPGEFKNLFEQIKLKRKGDRFTVNLELTTDQVAKLMKSAGAFGFGRRGL